MRWEPLALIYDQAVDLQRNVKLLGQLVLPGLACGERVTGLMFILVVALWVNTNTDIHMHNL